MIKVEGLPKVRSLIWLIDRGGLSLDSQFNCCFIQIHYLCSLFFRETWEEHSGQIKPRVKDQAREINERIGRSSYDDDINPFNSVESWYHACNLSKRSSPSNVIKCPKSNGPPPSPPFWKSKKEEEIDQVEALTHFHFFVASMRQLKWEFI